MADLDKFNKVLAAKAKRSNRAAVGSWLQVCAPWPAHPSKLEIFMRDGSLWGTIYSSGVNQYDVMLDQRPRSCEFDIKMPMGDQLEAIAVATWNALEDRLQIMQVEGRYAFIGTYELIKKRPLEDAEQDDGYLPRPASRRRLALHDNDKNEADEVVPGDSISNAS